METTTRRAIIAAAAALPLLPVASYAEPADPAVEAYQAWRTAFAAYIATLTGDVADDDPSMNAAHDAEVRAASKLADTVPITVAGLAAQLAIAHHVFGETSHDSDWDNLDAYHFGSWTNDRDGRLIRSMTAGAQRMAGVAS